MAFETDFKELMGQTVKHSTFASINAYGKASYATSATTYAALVQYEQKLVRAFDGSEKISSANAILACTGTIRPDDKLTLPDGTVPPILAVARMSDTGGQHHAVVYFGDGTVVR